MISVDVAVSTIIDNVHARTTSITVPVQKAVGCILTEDITAKQDIPRFDNSAMDGFVVRKEDWESGQRYFPIAFEIRPEDENPVSVPAEKCARILTGARIPEHGELVIPVEMASEKNLGVSFYGLPDRNPIRLKGEGYEKGKIILKKRSLVRSYELGLMIESGNKECNILKPLRVTLQITGSEINEKMNTNGSVLREILKSWPGVEIKECPVLEDDPHEVKNQLLALKEESDLILTTGGISAGKHDYLYSAMEEIGADILIRKINQKPGKPFTLSLWDDVPVCHLPGNPVSAIFCAEMYARLVVLKMLSIPFKKIMVKASCEMKNPGTKTLFVPGFARITNGALTVTAQARIHSHLLQLYSGKNVYVRLEPETEYSVGDDVTVIPFSNNSLPWM